MKLDIDRLHKVFHGELRGRGCGITTAVCYQALGYCEVDNKDIVIVVEFSNEISYIIGLLQNILTYENIRFKRVNENKLLIGHKAISIQTRSSNDDIIYRGYGRELIVLFDFNIGHYAGFNSAQHTWDDIMRAEKILWKKNMIGTGVKNIDINFTL